MFSNIISALLVPALLFSSVAQAAVDLSSVGPLTPLSSKSKICNVLDYGAVADNKTDIGPAILSAFTKCASAGGATIYVPPGSYSSIPPMIMFPSSANHFSCHWCCAHERLCLCSPNRWLDHSHLGRSFQRQCHHHSKSHRCRSLLQQRRGSNQRPRIHHQNHSFRTKC